MQRYQSLQMLVLIPCGLLVACGGGDDTGGACTGGTFPTAPAGASALLYVSATCPAEGADGSAAHPYPTISEAIDKATPATTILIAPGMYPENVAITQNVTLVGSSEPTQHQAAAVTIKAPGEHAIVVTGGEDVTLSGLRIVDSHGSGVRVKGAKVTIQGSSIEGTIESTEGIGSGVFATDDAMIILQNSAVTGAAKLGVHVFSARGIILQNSIISDCNGGGVRVGLATGDVQMERNQILDNTGMGIGVFSSRAIILQNTVKGTKLNGDGMGDGIVVAAGTDNNNMSLGPSDVELRDNIEISSHARVGVLFGAGTRGIILQNNLITQNGYDSAPGDLGAGIWLQEGAGGAVGNLIEGNVVSGNKFIGIGMTGDTHGIILQNNAVTETALGNPDLVGDIGDGIGLFAGASAQIVNGNTIERNGRLGLILDGADGTATAIDGNSFNENEQYGIILQNQMVEPPTGTNTFQGNKAGDVSSVPAGTFVVHADAFAISPGN